MVKYATLQEGEENERTPIHYFHEVCDFRFFFVPHFLRGLYCPLVRW